MTVFIHTTNMHSVMEKYCEDFSKCRLVNQALEPISLAFKTFIRAYILLYVDFYLFRMLK